MKAKIIAFYLPQFHTIPENDEWWGKGFTEWVNVKKARPIFKGHQQPRVPLNENYYDLSKLSTLQWQAQLANQYGIYGFCFYHYWFNGKLLLEKPSEMLLANKNVPMRFCFSWANEPWARTWDGKAHQVLMPQSYGTRDDWERHFYYLLPFFRDERYIKEDNCPMFLLYKSASIPCAVDMMTCWNKLANENGFNGIHFVETLRDGKIDNRPLPFKARVEFEPMRTMHQQNMLKLNYKRIRRRGVKLYNRLLNQNVPLNKPFRFSDVMQRSLQLLSPEGTYGGVFMGWDNSPRRHLASTIILPPTLEEFSYYLNEKINIIHNIYHTDYIFANAWNEWAEGTILEPDELHRYQYLEVIAKSVL